ncbi:uncharacterized protein A4U43_C10F14920 [Asparagus officinalis]|uniref:Uncharacterized protein n=1 Tax=Asparagus officinalis TaxID=4686 RepID=A0A5P1E2T1_ASPOF|nr:uncharacterized protein A4U43_C10F14920 [Asparagus officinalis]
MSSYDRPYLSSKAFDETKAGVKGLVDAGAQPSRFFHDSLFTDKTINPNPQISIPIIDYNLIKESKSSTRRPRRTEGYPDLSYGAGEPFRRTNCRLLAVNFIFTPALI